MEALDGRIPLAVIGNGGYLDHAALAPVAHAHRAVRKLAVFLHRRHEQVYRIARKEHLLLEGCGNDLRDCGIRLRGLVKPDNLRVDAHHGKPERGNRDVLRLARVYAAPARAHFRVREGILPGSYPLELLCAKDIHLGTHQVALAHLGTPGSINARAVNLHHLRDFGQVHKHHTHGIALANRIRLHIGARARNGQHGKAVFQELLVRHVHTVIFRGRFQRLPVVPGTFLQQRRHADGTPGIVRALEQVAERIPREHLQAVTKTHRVLGKDARHRGRLRVIHEQAESLHARAEFREEHAAFTFEVALHPHIKSVHVRAHVKHRLEHLGGFRLVGRPVRVIMQVHHVEVALAILLFGLTHNAQEFFHPVLAIKQACALLLHLVRAEQRTMQDNRRIHGLHRAGVFQVTCRIMPCRNRAGFFPLAVKFVTDLPLPDVVAFYFVCISHPGGSFLRSSRARVHANHGLRVRERLDILHELLEIPLDVGPVRAGLVAIARRHRVELVVVALEQVTLAAIELHLANLHALARQVGSLEADGHVAGPDLCELVLGRLRVHAHHRFRLQLVFERLVHARIFGIVLGPVRKLERLRAQFTPVNLQRIEIHLLRKFHHYPGRVHRVEDFAPPHRFLLAVGKVAPANKAVVVLRRTAVNRLAQESASPLRGIRCPEPGAIVAADSVPVVIVREAPVREAEQRVAAIHERIGHIVVTAGRVPNRKVRRHHVLLVDNDARMQVIDNHRVLGGKGSSNTSEYRKRTREQRGNIHRNLTL